MRISGITEEQSKYVRKLHQCTDSDASVSDDKEENCAKRIAKKRRTGPFSKSFVDIRFSML